MSLTTSTRRANRLARVYEDAPAAEKKAALKELQREQARWAIRARLLSPEEWHARVCAIPDAAVRLHVAQVVWWDFFSGRLVRNRATAFDELRAAWPDGPDVAAPVVSHEAMIGGLAAAGYPRRMARARVAAALCGAPSRVTEQDDYGEIAV